MKKRILEGFLMMLCVCFMQGCSVSFSAGKGNKDAVVTSNMVDAVTDRKIVMEDMTLELPDGMKYGMQDMDMGKAYYIWATDADRVSPNDEDIILYVYEGNDINSPDSELTNQEAVMSMQSYVQTFRGITNASVSSDPDVTKNASWYAWQFTGCSGDYEATSYGTMCYPKYYYGVYTLECMTDDYNRNFYGFIFSNDSAGEVMGENAYNFIYGQIKKSFSLAEFYTMPQLEYDEATDYSNGYNYDQLLGVFAEVQNYHGIKKNKTTRQAYDFVCVNKDGTIVVSDGTTTMGVELIGIDIPDIGSTRGQAAAYMEQLLSGKKLYLEYDGDEKNEAGSAYLFLDDNETMLNRQLLEKGFARYIPSETMKYAEEFEKLENEAKKNGEGLWETGLEESTN